ncbi:hypothetical protein [Labrys miyagiensis]|uniref:hypothetical protein n=1 Tax=Labrys miyagiensis TaxID=346912 RepID=UPI0024E04E3D|nr:hypothetical protein [Labrys miyagiensis]
MSSIDYDELVELWTLGEHGDLVLRDGKVSGVRVATLPLWKAVRIVMTDWEPDSVRQKTAQIMPKDGTPLLELEEIRQIFERADFPGPDSQ